MVKIFETLDNAQGLRFTPIAPYNISKAKPHKSTSTATTSQGWQSNTN
jgi:hypothetical protein